MLPYLNKFIYGAKDAEAYEQRCTTKAVTQNAEELQEKLDRFEPQSRKLFCKPRAGSSKIELVIGDFNTLVYEGDDVSLMVQTECFARMGDICNVLIDGVQVQRIEFQQEGCYVFNWTLKQDIIEFDEVIKK